MNRTFHALIGLMALALSGCQLVSAGREVSEAGIATFRPTGGGYRDDVNDPPLDSVDQWQFVGKEARGDRPMEHESDALTNYVSSPMARAINRNMRYD
jgi:hypothetical protein